MLTPTPLGEAWFTTREMRSAPAAEDLLELLFTSTLSGLPDVRGGMVALGISPFELIDRDETCPGIYNSSSALQTQLPDHPNN